MYEISLVPDIKAELLRKLRLRNLFILICIGVGIACGAIVLLLVTIMGGQALSIKNQKIEIGCRYDMRNGSETLKANDCKDVKETAVMRFDNMETLLTIQDQLKSLDTLNNSMIKFSRIFGLLDVLLLDVPDGEKIDVSELSTDFSTMTISFDAIGRDRSTAGIGFKPLEAFKKNAQKMHYDYGEYMRRDSDGNDVVIPHYCMSEKTINGLVYGVYSKGKNGCERPMVDEIKKEDKKEDSDDKKSDEDGEKSNEEDDGEDVKTEYKVTEIYIRRTYLDQKDYEKVRNGEDPYWDTELMGEQKSGYYFKSECISWNSEGKFDEDETLSACPFLSDEVSVNNASYGMDADEQMVLTFQASVPITGDIFLSGNHNMQIIGPMRQNVTDSYVQVRDMFASGNVIQKEEK